MREGLLQLPQVAASGPSGLIVSYANGLLEAGSDIIHDFMGAYEGAQLANPFLSRIRVTRTDQLSTGDPLSRIDDRRH